MTDAELRDAAWKELEQTTVGWDRVSTYPPDKLAKTHWGKGKALLDQIGITPPAPPSGDKLLFAPPPLSNPVTVPVTNANRRLTNLDNAKDYILDSKEPLTKELWIEGGRNVVALGFTVTCDTLGSGSSYQDNTAFKIRGGAAGGTVHLEGCLATGPYVLDGFGIGTPRIVQIQNSRLDGNVDKIKGPGDHADGIQIQDGCAGLRLDKVTLRSNLQCLYIHGYKPPTGQFLISRTDLVGVPGPNSQYVTCFFRNTGVGAARPQYTVEFIGDNTWMWRTGPPEDPLRNWVYPNNTGEVPGSYTDPDEAAVRGQDTTSTFITWKPAARITGRARLGASPGVEGPTRTDQRPAAGIGYGYVSPGYVS